LPGRPKRFTEAAVAGAFHTDNHSPPPCELGRLDQREYSRENGDGSRFLKLNSRRNDSRPLSIPQLDAAITRTLGILTGQIDKLMELFRVTNRQFYDEYQAARLTVGGSGGGATPPPA